MTIQAAKHSRKVRNPKILRQDNPYRVLGIAMIVDQKGIGARMVARYPTQPSDEQAGNEDIFYTLTPRQMAKLFRTKKSLCGQPMTLSVNSTVFCCRAILMEGDEYGSVDDNSSNNNNNTAASSNEASKDNLVLFSVIVALSSPLSHKSSFPTSAFATEDQLDLQRYIQSTGLTEGTGRKPASGRASASFLSIRRVHLSLARYCRVLEREERRCQYVSLQANLLFKIGNDRQKKWEEQKAENGTPSKQISNAGASSGSVMSGSSNQMGAERRGTERRGGRHNRNTSVGTIRTVAEQDESHSQAQQVVNSVRAEQEKEQEILELMLAAFPPENEQGAPLHYGNIIRELVQVFHSLSRNDHEFPPTPNTLLSERDAVVYVNQHIAIPIEAASLKPSQQVNGPVVRPYYTLLFPHASPSELLQAFQSSGSAPPQRLQQLLLTVNPQKPMSDIAIDANLPLYTTIEIATYLVTHGAAVTSPIVSRSSRLACHQIHLIQDLALEFSQTFADVDLFRLVSFLTSSTTLGEAMSVLTNLESDQGAWLRECLHPLASVPTDLSDLLAATTLEHSPTGPAQPQQQAHRWVEELEELLYAMAIWLLSHGVISQVQEYLVVVDSDETTSEFSNLDVDENLFRELLESDFLNGDVSVMALSWRTGLDLHKLKSWCLRHSRIRMISRIPAPGDDWELDPQ
jgi:hypothetical protein